VPLPILSLGVVVGLWVILRQLPMERDRYCWVPFAGATALFVLGFCGMAYSFYPYVVPEKLTIYEAALAPESLVIILVGTLFVLPVIVI
jgi:cytochrome d ubiquinol oxidase subunit II